jgi:MFS transporter, PPP family, 3-phenylpropionic acid transporter
MHSAYTIHKRQLLLICLCLGLILFQAALTIKLLPVYAVRLGADSAMTGLFVAVAFLTVTLGNITGGWLSDRFGLRKPFLLLSLLLWIPADLWLTQATTIQRLILAIGLVWFPGGIAVAMLNIIAAVSTGEGERGKVFGFIALASSISSLVAGLVGGPIAERWGFPVLFIVMAGATTVLLVIATWIQDKSTPRKAAQPDTQASMPVERQAGIGSLLPLFLVAHLMARLGLFIGGLGSPLAMTGLGFDAAAVSSTIAVSAALTLPLPLVLGWLSDRAGRKGFLLAAYALCAAGVLLLMSAQWLWQFWLSATLLVLFETTSGVAQAYVADLAPPQAMGRSISLFNTITGISGIVGLSGGGYLIQTLGLNPALVLGACLPVLGIGLLLRLRNPAAVADSPRMAQLSR